MADTYLPEGLLEQDEQLRRRARVRSYMDEFEASTAGLVPPTPSEPDPSILDSFQKTADSLLEPFRQKAAQARGMAEQGVQALQGMVQPQQPQAPADDPFESLLTPFRQRAEEQRRRENPSQYGAALTTLGGTPEAEAVTRPGGVAATAPRMSGGEYAPVAPDEPVTRETVTRAAATALARAGLPAEMAPYVAGIAINEGILQPGTIARDYWSVGGVKAPGTAGVVTVPTREVVNGQSVMETASFGKFNSMQEGMDSLATFIRDSPRFGPVAQQAAQTGDYAGMIEGFRQRGYATDPNWTRQVNSIAGSLPVPQQQSRPATSMPAAGESTSGAFQNLTKQWEGLPYAFGGKGGRGGGITATDCSGFVSEVWKQQGLDLPAHTDAAYNFLRQNGQAVDSKDARPGDVVFYMGAGTGGAITHHMGVVKDRNTVVDMSVAGGGGVKERPIGHAGEYVIMRDPRLNPPVPPQREEPAPRIIPTGIAEQTGGTGRIKGMPVEQAMASDRAMRMRGAEAGDVPRGGNPDVQFPAIREDVSGAYPPLTPQFDDPAGDMRGSGNQWDYHPFDIVDQDVLERERNPAVLSQKVVRPYASDESGIVYPGDEPLNGGMDGRPGVADGSGATARPVAMDAAPGGGPGSDPGAVSAFGPQTPYGVAGNVEPGDFSIPGRPLETAPFPQPDGGVESAASPADVTPPSSGNPIVDLFSEFGRKLSGVLAPQQQSAPSNVSVAPVLDAPPIRPMSSEWERAPQVGPPVPPASRESGPFDAPLAAAGDALGAVGRATEPARDWALGAAGLVVSTGQAAIDSVLSTPKGQALRTAMNAAGTVSDRLGPLMGREIAGQEQVVRENMDDEERARGLFARLAAAENAGDSAMAQSLLAELTPIVDRLNAAYAEDPSQAAERNPWKPVYEVLTMLPQVAAGIALTPTITGSGAASVPRQVAAAVIDPAGQIFGAGMETAFRGAGALGRVGGRAGDAAPAPGIISRAQADDAGQAFDRYYHGTGSDFARPDAGMFDPNGLFGPGYYVTSDARVASSYAVDKAGAASGATGVTVEGIHFTSADEVKPVIEASARYVNELKATGGDPYKVAQLERRLDALHQAQDTLSGVREGPNIRSVDVPNNINIFNVMDESDPVVFAQTANRQLGARQRQSFAEALDRATPTESGNYRNVDLWDALQFVSSKEKANAILKRMGYDGIEYPGGKGIPIYDEAGDPIEHTALVIFPESLDKIRNATAGTPGGFLPGDDPVSRRLDGTMLAGRTVGSGVGAAYDESQREGSTPESVAESFAGGAVMGIGGEVLRRGVGGKNAARIMRAVGDAAPDGESLGQRLRRQFDELDASGADPNDTAYGSIANGGTRGRGLTRREGETFRDFADRMIRQFEAKDAAAPSAPGTPVVAQGAADDGFLHIRNLGYMEKVDPDVERTLRGLAARVDERGPFSYSDVERYAREMLDPEKVANWAAKADPRLLAATNQAVRDGAAREIQRYQRALRGGEALRAIESPELADEILESASNALVGSAFLKGGPQLASQLGRALAQSKNVLHVAQAEAILESYQRIARGVQQRLPTLDKLRSGKKIAARDADDLDNLATALDSNGVIRNLTGANDGSDTHVARKIREAGTAASKQKADADLVELVKTNRAWLDAQDAGNLAKVEELGAKRDSLIAAIRERYEDAMPPKPPKAPEMPDPEVLLERADAQAAGNIGRRMRQDVIDAMGLANKNLDASDAARKAKAEIDAAVAALVGRGDPDGVAREAGDAFDRSFGAALDKVAKHARSTQERYELNALGQRARDRVRGIFAAAGDTERQVDMHQELHAILGELRGVSPRGKAMAEDILRAYDTRTQNALERARTQMARGAQRDTERLMREITDGHVRETADRIRELAGIARNSQDDARIPQMADELFRRLEQYGEIGKRRQGELKQSLVKSGLDRMIGKVDPERSRQFLVALASVSPEKPEQLTGILKGVRDGSLTDLLIEASTANMLSGPPTHAVNFRGNVLNGVGRFGYELPMMTLYDNTFARAGEALPWEKMPPKVRAAAGMVLPEHRAGMEFGDLRDAYAALWDARGAGLDAAAEIMRSGNTRASYETAAILGDFDGLRREHLTERFGNVGQLLQQLSIRPVIASDQIFSSMFEAGEMYRLAAIRARADGTTAEAVLDNLIDHVDILKQSKENAAETLLKTKSVVRRMLGAGEAAVSERSEGLGKAYKLASHGLMPFVTTPENIARQGASITPYVGPLYNTVRYAAAKEPEEKARRFSKIMAGLVLGKVVEAGVNNGTITGEGPKDPEVRRMMESESGWKPRSVRIAGQYVSYDGTPLAIPLATIATAMERTNEAIKKGEIRGDNPAEVAGTALWGGISGGTGAFLHQTFVRNLGEIYDALTGAPGAPTGGGIIAGYATRYIPAGSMLNYLGSLFDGMQRELRMVDPMKIGDTEVPFSGDRAVTGIMQRLPGVRTMLPERQDVLGRPMANEQAVPGGLGRFVADAVAPQVAAARWVTGGDMPAPVKVAADLAIGRRSTVREDPLIRSLLNLGVDITPPPESTRTIIVGGKEMNAGREIELTPAMRRAYLENLGEVLRTGPAPSGGGARNADIITMLGEQSDSQGQRLQMDRSVVKGVVDKARDQAMVMVKQDPRFAKHFR